MSISRIRLSRATMLLAALCLSCFSVSALANMDAGDTPDNPVADATASPAPKPPELTALSASYTAAIEKGVAINGTATLSLKPDKDGTWLYRFDVDSFLADIRESVRFRWQDGHVVPLTYRYSLSGMLIPDRKNSLDFDWEGNQVSGTIRGKTFTMALTDHALDRLSLQIQLLQDIKANQTEMHYKVTDKARFEDNNFAVIGEEMLDTKLGRVRAIKAEKVRAPDSERQTYMWFAPDLNYLLIKLVQVETDGTHYEINIDNANVH